MPAYITPSQAARFGLDGPKRKPRAKKPSPNHSLFLAECRAHGLPEPRPEVMFHPVRKWRFDWLFELNGRRVGLEIDGGLHGKPCKNCHRVSSGGHGTVSGIKRDMQKSNEAQLAGYVFLRVLPEHVQSGEAFALVARALGWAVEALRGGA